MPANEKVELQWGDLVRVTRGALKGRLGVYDDDLDDENGAHRIAVYLDGPPPMPYYALRLDHVTQASEHEERRWERETGVELGEWSG